MARTARFIVPPALAVALAAGAAAACAREPKAPAAPAEIVAYHDSGEWDRDSSLVVRAARRALTRHLHDPGGRAAIVLDVDDTALSSYACLKRSSFASSALRACAEAADMPAVPQTRRLYRYARRWHVTVFFITGRREVLRPQTLANLRRAGFTGRRRLTMRPDEEAPGTHHDYKVRTRRELIRGGYRIVVNVGDQRSDLRGGAARGAFKLPNPMYVIR